MIPILLADNQPIFRAGAVRVLTAQKDIHLLAQFECWPDLLRALEDSQDCLLLVAHTLIDDMHELVTRASSRKVRVILLTEGNADAANTVARHLSGLISRHASADDVLRCIRQVAAGERSIHVPGESPEDATGRRIRDSLTARELQIVGYIVQGWKNRQVSDEIGTKEQVVKNYLRSIYDKTGASDRLELALFTLHHRVLAEAAAKAIGPAASTPR